MVWLLYSEDSNRVGAITMAAVHRNNAAQLCTGVFLLNLRATGVSDAIAELAMTDEDLDRVSVMRPGDFAGIASEEFVAKIVRWSKGDLEIRRLS